ncbi:MAG: radical SAM protein [candidate division KSB1 bacterium]|nr:radical SAM protein [candidate division KSB1 bacterium]
MPSARVSQPSHAAATDSPPAGVFLNDTNSSSAWVPGYLTLHRSGELRERAHQAALHLEDCHLCPRECGVNRRAGELGVCRMGPEAVLYKPKLHFGEEPPISGTRGSGILFFSGCALACAFCQNFPMSHWRLGHVVSPATLARAMLFLQRSGAHNINLVTATHFLPRVLEALELAAGQGLRLPVVYNSSGYESLESLHLLEGVVDVYLPDYKYADATLARRYSGAADYPEVCLEALREMLRQVGHLQVDQEGIARRGLLVRHLVLPGALENTERVLAAIARELGPDTHVSLMSQYLPIWEARRFPELMRRVSTEEYQQALAALERHGLEHGWVQEWT